MRTEGWRSAGASLLLLMGGLPGLSADVATLANGKIHTSGVRGLEEAYLPIVFPSSHAANLLALPGGDLLCTYFSGRWEGESGVAIVVARLPHGSSQWSKPSVAAQKSGWSYQNPVLFWPSGGPLWLLHTSQGANAGQSHSQMSYLTSADRGKTWSAPKLLFSEAGAFDRQRLLVVGNKWLLPMYFTPSYGITKNAISNYSVVQVSSDRGQTWKTCAIPKSEGLVQPDVLQLAPDKFVAFFRSRYADWVYKSESKDGCTWAVPEPTQIPNNNSSIQVALLKDGHLAIAFNNSQEATSRGKPRTAPRWPLSVALSTDGGRTWPWVRDIETGERAAESEPPVIAGVTLNDRERKEFVAHRNAYGYPSIIQTADGKLNVAYTFHRRTIKYVRFAEGWIKGGGTEGVFHGDRSK